MYKVIDKYNKIFKLNEFQKDKYKFYIVFKILTDENPIIYSNEEDYFLIRSDNNHPIWIWTKNNIDKSYINAGYIKDGILIKFSCSKEMMKKCQN